MVLHGLLGYGRKLNEHILSSKRDPESNRGRKHLQIITWLLHPPFLNDLVTPVTMPIDSHPPSHRMNIKSCSEQAEWYSYKCLVSGSPVTNE